VRAIVGWVMTAITLRRPPHEHVLDDRVGAGVLHERPAVRL
jgi:hypothetical protein